MEVNSDEKSSITDKVLEIINIKINSLEEILDYLNEELETITLNFNNITRCNLSLLPTNIKNLKIENNLVEIEELIFNYNDSDTDINKHKWNELTLKNSNIKNINEINNLYCKKLDLSENDLSVIKFTNCKIRELYVNNNNINNIIFDNCEIKKIDLSHNILEKITNLPTNLININLSNNLFKNIETLPENLKILDLSDNLLEEIKYIPPNILKLEINNNKLKSFDVNLLSKDIKYFDITNNLIKNNKLLFSQLEAEGLFYDTDSDEDENEDDDNNSDISIKFIKYECKNNELEETKVEREYDSLIPVDMKWKLTL